MKHFAELTEAERQLLCNAQVELREKALIFANKPAHEEKTDLYIAARRFADCCDSLGLTFYWKTQQTVDADDLIITAP
jgi:hypothetical protein